MGKNLIALLLLPLLAVGQWEVDFDEDWQLATSRQAVPQFRVTFLTGTFPTNIVLHADYAGPATAANALYDSGDGVWTAYTDKNIPVKGSYVAFAGDWRTSAGTYNSMFRSTFQSAAYTARMSGQLTQKPSTNANAYRVLFYGCTAITEIQDNPMPLLTGAPATYMFNATCYNMTGVTSLPDGFMDTSGLTGAPAAYMFCQACNNMSGVTNLPAGFMDTSGLIGAPVVYMFYLACNNMTGVTSLPDGFMDTSGLTGAPANYMFAYACYNMSKVTSLPTGFMNTSGLTGAPAGYMFQNACYNMSGVTGALPTGFMNTSGLTGAPAAYMFFSACNNMSKVTSLPTGFMDTSGLTGAPAAYMFYSACYNMSGVTGALPTGFMDTSGLTGTPAAGMFTFACQGMSKVTSLPGGFMNTSGLTGAPAGSMFYKACYNMSGVTNAYTFNIGAGVTFTATNAVGPLDYAWRNMPSWPGTVMWGTNVLFSQFAPTNRIYTIQGSTNVPGYDGFDTNWK